MKTNLKSFPDRYFKNPTPSQEIFEEHLERLFNILTSALCEPLKTTTTVELRHDVLRQVIKKALPLNTKIWLEEADFDPRYFPRGWASSYVTKRGDKRTILFPVAVRLFLGRSRKLYCEDGRELPRRWIEKLSISCVKQTHWWKNKEWKGLLYSKSQISNKSSIELLIDT